MGNVAFRDDPRAAAREPATLPATLIDVLIQPRAARDRVGPIHGDRLKIAVTAPPVDGAANDAVIAALAKALSVPRRTIEVVSGHSARRKTIRVTGLSRRTVEERLT